MIDVVAYQVALLHSIAAVFDQLTRVLSLVEVTKLAAAMLESIPTRDLPSQLTQAKLVAIRNMVAGKLFKDDDGNQYVLKYIVFFIGELSLSYFI